MPIAAAYRCCFLLSAGLAEICFSERTSAVAGTSIAVISSVTAAVKKLGIQTSLARSGRSASATRLSAATQSWGLSESPNARICCRSAVE